MLRKIWKLLGVVIALFVIVGVFLSPIAFMFTIHWSAGFLFFVSWIPATFLLGSIIQLVTD